MQDILGKKVPLPVLYFANDMLFRNEIIDYNSANGFYKPVLPKEQWKNAINQLKVSNIAIMNFEKNIKLSHYVMPPKQKIIIKELTEEEYLKQSEFYDHEFASLFVGNGTYNEYVLNSDYLHRSFAYKHIQEIKDKKKLHILVAESENHVLGYISISNYIKGYDDFFNHGLPCKDEEIFYVNYIQTRQEAKRRHIASALLGYALNEVFYNDNAYAVNYEAICTESELLLNSVTKNMKLDVYKRKYETSEEYKKYGSMHGHILTKKEAQNCTNNTPEL